MVALGSESAGDPARKFAVGPLGAFAAGLRVELIRQKFNRHAVVQHIHLLAHLSGWLYERKLTANDRAAPRRC
jgi:hypothetical protein